ncbi:DNA-binding FadR family transcriptional regulator [Labrenzia sp. EL_208]|uniref:FadR/GntR family transcriptional regulator n=1 Tax=Roseibium album TaxID=311410 RepID=UPI0018C9838C|nr:FCD domain-containing protein [Roseibium album]MBG6178497.1 DNA-binding FadR family transcriptional regulator [Labrenzia sp. EL_132]MBG6202471.1 DNA-binding FadR family transcriptional regulator [Labrenzia sp. EL_13]MBG6211992.1 DNA-binding FadR family transcriptional regulator [Labrenzia sp. EL_126]MBG6233120.1 DNA-binding FadR family transcriptional regulator [Labrenzia sp. EL_208]MCR9057178.1 FCD domain-containing protein [Paracoccaceae bacterium]
MIERDRHFFELPDKILTSLPTGAVKDTVEQLGRRIVLGYYPLGNTLPKEEELVGSLGVSRTVIREAVKVLCGKGLVRTARRYGSRVCQFSDWNLLDPDVIRWHTPECPMTARIYAEATQLRFIFEPEAAALAALNASQRQRETIVAAARNLHSNDGANAMIGADYAFHSTILQASGSLMLAHFQNLIHAVLVLSYAAGRNGVPEETLSRQNHINVANAIYAANAEQARAKMRNMLMLNQAIADRITAGT